MDSNLTNVPGSPPGPRSVSVPPITARDIIGMLRRRIWLIVIVMGLVTVLSVVLWMVLLIFNPKFTSTGYIQVRMPVREDVLATVAMIPRADIIDLETKRKARQLTSDGFLISLLEEPKVSLRETKWYKKYGNNLTKRLDLLQRNFKAVALQAEGLVRVSMTTSDRRDSQTILEVALRQFQNEIKDVADLSLSAELTTLKEQRDLINQKISTRRGQLNAIHQGIDVPGWQSGNSPILQELMILGQERLRLQAVLLEVSSRSDWLDTELTDNSYSNAVRSAVDDDGMVLSFQNQISSLEVERERLLRKFGQDHDQVKTIVASIEGVQAQLASREEKLLTQYSQIERTELDRTYQENTQALDAVEGDISSASARQADVEQKLADYLALTQEIVDLNRQLERYENKINATSTLKRDPSHVQIRVLSYGEDPLKVSFPLLKIFLPGGVFFGLMFALGLMFLLEFLDDTIKSPGDVMRYLPVPMLGMIPEYEQDNFSNGGPVEKLAFTQPQSLLSESYRQLKTSLQFSAPADSIKSLLLTGVSASSGTTTTAVNMAVTLVKAGKRVLLVDANFHRPRIRELFENSAPSNGLSHYLVGQKDASDVIRSSNLKGLDVVESGPQPPNPSDLLDSNRMRQFLSQQKAKYDYVMIDGPPSLLVSEARVLGSLVDGSILVVHAGQTSRGVVLRMIREFRSANIRILGLVLNAVRPRKGGYFREAFDSYYDYVGGEFDGRDKLEEELVSSGEMDTGSEKTS